jgi:hypothetical protein
MRIGGYWQVCCSRAQILHLSDRRDAIPALKAIVPASLIANWSEKAAMPAPLSARQADR